MLEKRGNTALNDKCYNQIKEHVLEINPFYVLGLACNASRRKIIRTQERHVKLAKLSASSLINGSIEVDYDEVTMKTAIQQSQNIKNRIFWFYSPERFLQDSKLNMNMKIDSLDDFDNFVYLNYYLFCSESSNNLRRIDQLLTFIDQYRSFYPCFEDLLEVERRYTDILDDISLSVEELYLRINDNIDDLLIRYIKSSNSFNTLFSIFDLANNYNKNNLVKIIELLSKEIVLATEIEYLGYYKKFSDNLLKLTDSSWSSKKSLMMDEYTIIKSEVNNCMARLQSLKHFDSFQFNLLTSKLLEIDMSVISSLFKLNDYKSLSIVFNQIKYEPEVGLPIHYKESKELFKNLEKGYRRVEELKSKNRFPDELKDTIKNVNNDIYFIILWAYANISEYQLLLGRLSIISDMQIYKKYGIRLYKEFGFGWVELAAKNGNIEAQYYLALLLLEGTGTFRNMAKSLEWLQIAAKNGHQEARSVLLEMGKKNNYGWRF